MKAPELKVNIWFTYMASTWSSHYDMWDSIRGSGRIERNAKNKTLRTKRNGSCASKQYRIRYN